MRSTTRKVAIFLVFFTVAALSAAEPPNVQRIREFLAVADAKPESSDDLLDIFGGRLGLSPSQTHATNEQRIELYSRYLSDEDLRGLTRFFKTATGRHLADVAPQFAAAARSALQATTVRYIEQTKQRDLEHRTRNDFRALGFALSAYFADHKSYPEAAAQLVPNYTARVPDRDAWGHPIRYRLSDDGKHYWVASAGIDGRMSPVGEFAGSDDIVFSDGHFINNDEPVASPSPSASEKNPSTKTTLIRELLKTTEAQDTTADSVIDIIGGRLGLGIAPEETRGEAREGPQMVQITDETLVPIYNRFFSEAQLRRLLGFFKTEMGEHYVDAARKIAAATRKRLQSNKAAAQ